MLAAAGELPLASPHAWAVEMKWDGVRAISYVTASRVRIVSRSDRDVTVSYPELHSLGEVGRHDLVLDGEIVALNEGGRPDFGMLQTRMNVTEPRKVHRLLELVTVRYLLFDVLAIDGTKVLEVPYAKRRELLTQLELDAEFVAVPPAFEGNPADAMQASLEAGLEGVVCKRLDSVYVPGRRSASWVKVKHQRTQEVVIIGWESGGGRRAGGIGALLLGVHAGGALRYAGQVGTGFTERALAELLRQLESVAVSTPAASDVPEEFARAAHWVRPVLVGEVAFGEWTADGRLRHASWRGLRPDKAVTDVVRE